MRTIKTRLHTYSFNVRKPAEREAYTALLKTLKGLEKRRMHSWGGGSHCFAWVPSGGVEVELETDHLFDNQWNTAPFEGAERGYRVFDWASDACLSNKNIRCGHYLEQTEEMAAVRDNTHCCGYCGEQEPAAKGYAFCPHCLGSPYLEESQLYMLRMLPCSVGRFANNNPRQDLSEAELAHLLPLFKAAREAATRARAAKLRAESIADCECAIHDAITKRDGLLWLFDHDESVEDVIFYTHTKRFAFGWRKGVSEEEASRLETVLCEFPFDYDIERKW